MLRRCCALLPGLYKTLFLFKILFDWSSTSSGVYYEFLCHCKLSSITGDYVLSELSRTKIIFFTFIQSIFLLTWASLNAADAGFLSTISKSDIDTTADKLDFVGSNIIASGHVFIKYQDMRIQADKAIINVSTRDVEATGNVKFIKKIEQPAEVKPGKELEKLEENLNIKVINHGYVTQPDGTQKLHLTLIKEEAVWEGERAVGNLNTGIFDLGKFSGKYGYYYCDGEQAERQPDGSITVRNVRLSTCEYMVEEHEHYSITASRIRLIPDEAERELKFYSDHGHYSLWAYNCVFYIGDMPILWFPVLYKPSDTSGLGVQIIGGEDKNWGYFLLTKKTFNISDYPNTKTSALLDYYSTRGFGYGNETKIRTEKTYTEIFGYGVRDRAPYGPDEDGSEYWHETNDRLETPRDRHDLRLSHLNHITPRMDFRGHIEKLSDIDFLDHYFPLRFQENPQPATFADIEYQFDRLSATFALRPRINSFFSEVERLPEFRLDFPRQELWRDLYYQGETSISRLKMRWRDYEKVRSAGNLIDPADYKSSRFDTLHMFYYPFTLDWLNVIPRTGFRLTYYSDTSKTKIRPDDLGTMFIVDSPSDDNPIGDVVNYDDDRGEKWRFAGELGLELNTRIYNSWQNVKNAFWQIDGLRHVMVPYVNYNFIPKPTLNRDKIYYFEDIDRLNEQNFVRLGLQNRLQTRCGTWETAQIYNWATLENYFDFHLKREEDFKHVGDFGTKLKFTPFPNLLITSDLLIDAGQSNDHDTKTARYMRTVDRKWLSWKYINKFQTSITYKILDDLRLYATYSYRDAYKQRSIYSMGSSLSDITSGSSFIHSYAGRSQVVTGGMEFPIPIDDKTRGDFSFSYDFEAGYMIEKKFRLIRNLHCWEAAVEFSQKYRRNHWGEKDHKNSVVFMLYLTEIPGAKISIDRRIGGAN